VILEILLEAFYKTNLKQMPFFFKDDFSLMAFATTENDVKKAVNRMPLEPPQVFFYLKNYFSF